MDNRSHILKTALDLFAERGYDAVGVQDIASAASITKPTLYHYFGSKHGLLETVLREQSAALTEQLGIAASYTGDLPRSLTAVVATCFAFAQTSPQFYRLYLSTWFALPANEAHTTALPFHEAVYQLVETLFEQAAHDHGNMRGRQRAYATTLLGAIHTYIGMALNGYTTLNDTLVQQAVQQFSHGIYS